jgi:hypothetical protein
MRFVLCEAHRAAERLVMEHPFKVGGRYRNRLGEYEVVAIQEPYMTIRYLRGKTMEVDAELQARIWRNIQAENRIAPERKRTASKPRPKRRTVHFAGLEEGDFKDNVTGTHWRARDALGGLLAQHTSALCGCSFESHAIYRRPEVHIVRPEWYDTRFKSRKAKFVLELDTNRARYGFYVERTNDPMDSSWDWLRFERAVSVDEALRDTVEKAMEERDLEWIVEVWPEGASDPLTTYVRGKRDIFEWNMPDAVKELPRSEFLAQINRLVCNHWLALYLGSRMTKDDAIAAGPELADQVAQTYRRLWPLYKASANPAR